MDLSKIIVSFATILLTCSFLNNSCYALETGDASFMDLESSVRELRTIISKNRPGTVSVAVYDDTGTIRSSGSGFFIDKEGRIITNASIWKDAYSASVASEVKTYGEISIINLNDDLDIALIKVEAANENALEMDFNYNIRLGERVIIIGKKTDLTNTLSEGLISALPETERNLRTIEIQTVAPLLRYPTSNDGPVLNTDGKVIGVASNTIIDGKISDGTWRTFNNDQMYAISIQSIKPLLSNSGRLEHLHPAKSKVWLKWFVSSLKSNFLKGFVFLYSIGSMKIIGLLLVVILISYIVENLYVKYIKHRYNR